MSLQTQLTLFAQAVGEDIKILRSTKRDLNAVLSDTGTSGTVSKSTTTVTVSPSANSTRVVFGSKVELSYSSSFNMLPGGWLTSEQKVINTAGSGTIDKLVCDMVQLNLVGGNIAAAVGYEAVLSQIGPSTIVNGLAMFYVANMTGVANIGNVQQLAAFQNDHPQAFIRSLGPYLNADSVELTTPFHAGLMAGRYYSAHAKSMTTNIVTANAIYVTYVHVPKRTTITKLGFNVTTAAAGNARLGIYKVKDGALTTLVAQGSNISTASTGEKESTISAAVDSGVYAVVAVFSGTPVIAWHEISSHSVIGAGNASGYSEFAYIAPFSFGALPATANITPAFAANTIEPHLWFRVGV